MDFNFCIDETHQVEIEYKKKMSNRNNFSKNLLDRSSFEMVPAHMENAVEFLFDVMCRK